MDTFERWAKLCPEKLARAVQAQPPMPIHLLTYAAEALGQCPAPVAVPALVPLTAHADAVVREGALYGLAQINDAECIALLRTISEKDLSPTIREIAQEMLE
jgi:HEAT repeat protein